LKILTLIYNFDDNNILINLFEVFKISIMQFNDNKIKPLNLKMQVIIYPMNKKYSHIFNLYVYFKIQNQIIILVLNQWSIEWKMKSMNFEIMFCV
jgi:hypothetical protein